MIGSSSRSASCLCSLAKKPAAAVAMYCSVSVCDDEVVALSRESRMPKALQSPSLLCSCHRQCGNQQGFILLLCEDVTPPSAINYDMIPATTTLTRAISRFNVSPSAQLQD